MQNPLKRLASLLGLKAGGDDQEREVEEILGHHFSDSTLLRRALTHRSFLIHNNGEYREANELLEFLGDAVLGLIVVEHLYRRYPNKSEGELSKLKSILVSGVSLHKHARNYKFGKFLYMSDNEARNGGRKRGSILENAFEALLGALYLDGGYDAAQRFVERNVLKQVGALAKDHRDYNPKSRLLEFAQAHGLPTPVYQVLQENGPDHAKQFEVEVTLNGKTLGRGVGPSKKAAQQQAAHSAVEHLPEIELPGDEALVTE